MKKIESECREYSDLWRKQHIDQRNVQRVKECAMQALLIQEKESRLSYLEFLYQQSRYIRKRWWVLQAVILIFLWMILEYCNSGYYVQRCMGTAASFLAILLIPELWKNRSCGSMEIEGTSRYSLRQIYAARMVLFAFVDIILLSVFVIAATQTELLSAQAVLFHFLLPFNVTCCICFRTLCSLKFGSEQMALLFCFVWVAVWLLFGVNQPVYEVISMPVLGGLIMLSLIYMAYSARKAWMCCEKQWEGTVSWN